MGTQEADAHFRESKDRFVEGQQHAGAGAEVAGGLASFLTEAATKLEELRHEVFSQYSGPDTPSKVIKGIAREVNGAYSEAVKALKTGKGDIVSGHLDYAIYCGDMIVEDMEMTPASEPTSIPVPLLEQRLETIYRQLEDTERLIGRTCLLVEKAIKNQLTGSASVAESAIDSIDAWRAENGLS